MEKDIIKLSGHVVIRVESDDYALLYNPDSDERYVLNPVSVYICENLNGKKTLQNIIDEIKEEFAEVPDDAAEKVLIFVKDLIDKNLAFIL